MHLLADYELYEYSSLSFISLVHWCTHTPRKCVCVFQRLWYTSIHIFLSSYLRKPDQSVSLKYSTTSFMKHSICHSLNMNSSSWVLGHPVQQFTTVDLIFQLHSQIYPQGRYLINHKGHSKKNTGSQSWGKRFMSSPSGKRKSKWTSQKKQKKRNCMVPVFRLWKEVSWGSVADKECPGLREIQLSVAGMATCKAWEGMRAASGNSRRPQP